jgi:hypothetical protein
MSIERHQRPYNKAAKQDEQFLIGAVGPVVKNQINPGQTVRGRSKPASEGRIKTSQFEGIIIGWGVHENETLTGESTQIERATIDLNTAPGGLVQPGHCA